MISLRIWLYRTAACSMTALLLLTLVHGLAAARGAESQPDRLLATPVRLETVERILSLPSQGTVAVRLKRAPRLLVIVFASSHEQAAMLNRVAILVELRGLPRDHILSEARVGQVLHDIGRTYDGFYDGHDYRLSDLYRFFDIARSEGAVLNAQELRLRALLKKEDLLRPGARGAVITIAPPDAMADPAIRSALFQHEFSHAAYFCDAAYFRFVRRFWGVELKDTERAAIRKFLHQNDYDDQNEDLMANEAQAYMFNSPNGQLFQPGMIKMTPSRYEILRQRFLNAMPRGWFKDTFYPH